MLEEVIEKYADKNGNDLNDLNELEEEKERFALGIFSLSLLSVIEPAAEILEVFNFLKTKFMPLIVNFFVPGGIALLGISSVISFYEGNKQDGFGKLVRLHKTWNELPLEKRKVLCEKLDEKYRLNPMESYGFLSSWLSKANLENNTFRSSLERTFTDDFIDKIRSDVEKISNLETEVREMSNQITELLKRISDLEERLDRKEREDACERELRNIFGTVYRKKELENKNLFNGIIEDF